MYYDRLVFCLAILFLAIMTECERGWPSRTAHACELEIEKGNSCYAEETKLTDYAALVESLAMQNPEPKMVGEEDKQRPIFSPGYNWEEQGRVLRTIDVLGATPEKSWTFLIKHLRDERYCITLDGGRSAENVPVAGVCEIIIVGTLTAGYLEHIPSGEAAYFQLRNPELIPYDELETWLKQQQARGKSVADLQIDLCEWAVKQIEKMSSVTRDERVASIRKINDRVATIRKTRAPYPFEDFILSDSRVPFTKERAEKLRAKLGQ